MATRMPLLGGMFAGLGLLLLLQVLPCDSAELSVEVSLANRRNVVLSNTEFQVWLNIGGVERVSEWHCTAEQPLQWSFHLSPNSPALTNGAVSRQDCLDGSIGQSPVLVTGPGIASLGETRLYLLLRGGGAVVSQVEVSVYVIPGAASVLPPLVAIACAVLTRHVIPSLMAGIWLGALLTEHLDPLRATLRYADLYIVDALATRSHAQILLFALLLGGLVELMARSGGSTAVVAVVSGRVGSSRAVQLVVWLLGLLVFFDDYSTILVVGPALLPLADHFGVSRAKLAFLVDTTAASTASIALVSSWLGFQLGLIQAQFDALGIALSPFRAFALSTLYRFYDVGLGILVLVLLVFRLDFGPMYEAELCARMHGRTQGSLFDLDPQQTDASEQQTDGQHQHSSHETTHRDHDFDDDDDDDDDDEAAMLDSSNNNDAEQNDTDRAEVEENEGSSSDRIFEEGERSDQPWWNTVVPVLVLLTTIIVGLLLDGYTTAVAQSNADDDVGLEAILAYADSFSVLIWGALFSSVVAVVMVTWQRRMDLEQALDTWFDGTKTVVVAVFILLHSWAIGVVCEELQSSRWLLALLGDTFPVALLPVTVCMLAMLISFCTGSSWATLAMGFPIVVPLAWALGHGDELLLCHAMGALFSGAIFGDHASPLSDTTILTSTMCRCDVMLHVKTQLPYALVTALAALCFGHLFCGLFMPFPVAHLCTWLAIALAVWLLGKRIPLSSGVDKPLSGVLDTTCLLTRLPALFTARLQSLYKPTLQPPAREDIEEPEQPI